VERGALSASSGPGDAGAGGDDRRRSGSSAPALDRAFAPFADHDRDRGGSRQALAALAAYADHEGQAEADAQEGARRCHRRRDRDPERPRRPGPDAALKKTMRAESAHKREKLSRRRESSEIFVMRGEFS
jgi:hypothetical protein